MVDRMFALWQVLYPDSYVEPQAQWSNSFWYSQGDVLDANTGLKPFYSDSTGDFWTSNTVRDLTQFGYTYSDLSNDVNSIRTTINTLYGPSTSQSKVRRATASDSLLWQISVRSPKNAIDSVYFIDFFQGPPASEDPNTWSSDPNLIGTHAVISMMMEDLPSVTTTGVVPLNAYLDQLLASGQLPDLSEESVINMLRDALVWRVRQGDGSEVLAADVPDLKVAVASALVQAPLTSDAFPEIVGDWTVYPAVTSGKAGGLHVGDPI
jgi:tyrosinase